MLKINLETGTMFTRPIITRGNLQSDLIQCIDDFVSTYGIDALPVVAYDMTELIEDEIDNYIPVNGGQWFIAGISSVDEIDEIEGIKGLILTSYSSLRNELYVYDKNSDKLLFTIQDGLTEDYILNDGDIDDDKIVSDFYNDLFELLNL